VTDQRELEQVAQAVEAVSGRHSSEVLEQELCVDEVRVGQHALDVLQISVVLEGALVQLGALAQLGDLEAVWRRRKSEREGGHGKECEPLCFIRCLLHCICARVCYDRFI